MSTVSIQIRLIDHVFFIHVMKLCNVPARSSVIEGRPVVSSDIEGAKGRKGVAAYLCHPPRALPSPLSIRSQS
jgi:hypothetical protein